MLKSCKTWNKEKNCYWNATRWHYPLINYFNQTQVLAYQNFKNKTPAVWHRCHTPFIRHHIFNSIPVILPNGWKIYWGFYTFRVSRLNISIRLLESLKFIQSEMAAKIRKKISQFYLMLHFQFFDLLRMYENYSIFFPLFEIFSSPAEMKRVEFTFFPLK